MKGELATITPENKVIQWVLDSVTSEHSKRAYKRALVDFLAWCKATGNPPIVKATVQRYKAELEAAGFGAPGINQRLSAIRKLASEAADNGVLDDGLANGVMNVKGVKQDGRRAGNWLTQADAQALLDSIDGESLADVRDRAILAVLLGCGLRRSEAANLTWEHIQQRDGRWVILDLIGKRGRVRTVPMPSWCKKQLDEWALCVAPARGRVFMPIDKAGNVVGDHVSAQSIYNVVEKRVEAAGLDIAPHDLRRTFAKLAHKGKSPIEQIQLSLGHASLKTTELYLGIEQNLADAPCDRLGLEL